MPIKFDSPIHLDKEVQVKDIESSYSGKHPNLCKNVYIKRRMTAKTPPACNLMFANLGPNRKHV